MFISVSKHADQWMPAHKYFRMLQCAGAREVVSAMAGHAWSPIIWANGIRLSKNFGHAEVLAFDFDDGITIEEITAKLRERDLSYIIGTTKSHQKPKGQKPAVDRFRVVLFAERPITNVDDYQHTMWKYLTEIFNKADKACRDPARYFYPCEPHSYEEMGLQAEVFPAPPGYSNQKYQIRPVDISRTKALRFPQRVKKLLQGPVPDGQRNLTAYKIGLEFGKLQIPLETAVAKAANVIKGLEPDELERAISNGWNYGRAVREEWERGRGQKDQQAGDP